ncbi:hypothetical protein MKUB_06280 [Mycobacterium kubicae]|uniref:Uncharacterized protein n=1 Tax=Mycobacterium kubicae TaxID=120959 RepID=A0ABQ1BHE6_9MYCO|nr:hypothetical protein MKUB_06280 [Mycobacterium kubicae]
MLTTSEPNIITGKARKVGLRAIGDPEAHATAITANVATDMTTGSTRSSRPEDVDRGTSGGAATSISADRGPCSITADDVRQRGVSPQFTCG